MQEEIKKHSKKIFSIAGNRNASIAKKVREVLLEILIIFIAVSISVWFHNQNEKKHQQQEVKEFLTDIKEDLLKDRATYLRHVQYHNSDSLLYQKIIRVTKSNSDTTKIKINFVVRSLNLSCGNYEGFKTSGKIGYIKNKELKKKLLAYYEDNIPNLKFGQTYYSQESNKFIETIFDNAENLMSYVCTNRVKSKAQNFLLISSSINDQMKKSVTEIDAILREIAKEVPQE